MVPSTSDRALSQPLADPDWTSDFLNDAVILALLSQHVRGGNEVPGNKMARTPIFRSPASHWQPWRTSASNEKTPEEGTASPPAINETSTNSNIDSGSATPNHSFGHQHHRGRRIRQFVRPNGRKVHIAHTPEEHEHVRKRLLEVDPDHDFDVIIHGTPEHLEAVRELHTYQTQRRATLRDQHGDLYDQFEHVKNELDTLSDELHMLTEHGVALDANFSKFGYSAHLRTKDDDDDETISHHGDHDDSSLKKHQDRTVDAIKFFKRPVIRQYFHKGLLWRSSRSGQVGSFELFVDLLYVGIIGIIGDKALEDPNGRSLVEYCITFLIGWKIWADLTMMVNWFEQDDIAARLSVLIYLTCLFGLTTNMTYGFDSTYTIMIAFYLAERFYAAFWHLFTAYMVPNIKGCLLYHALNILVSSAFWIGSIHVPWPRQLPLIWIAMCIDLFGWLFLIWTIRHIKQYSNGEFYHRYFDFMPAVNIEHRTERNNAFTSLVFGYSVLTILYQNRAAIGVNAFFGKGILGLIQAFAFNWIYFEVDQIFLHVHAIRRHWLSSCLWITTQVPFIMGYILAAASLSKLVLAHDCSDADPETLGETYRAKSVADVESGVRWFYCGGLGLALFCMSVISFCHIHKRLEHTRLKKRPRLFVRVCVAIAIICLPTAGDRLSSLDLIAITTALTVYVLILDLYGMSVSGGQFWTGGWCENSKKNCKYSAKCHISKKKKRQIEEAMKKGEKLDLETLLRRSGTASSSTSTSTSLDLEEKGEEGGPAAAWHGFG